MAYEGKNLETIALHAGWRNDETTGSVAVPLTVNVAANVRCVAVVDDGTQRASFEPLVLQCCAHCKHIIAVAHHVRVDE